MTPVQRLPGRVLLADAVAALSLSLLCLSVAGAVGGRTAASAASLLLRELSSGTVVFVLGFGGVGWLLARRLPRHPIGWSFLLGGLVWSASAVGDTWVGLALARGGELGAFTRVCANVSFFGWIFAMPLSVQLPLLLLPDGRLLSRRWRPAVWLVAVGVAVGTAGFVTIPGLVEGYDPALRVVNPLGVRALGPIPQVLALSGAAMLMAALLAGSVSATIRFRRSRGGERQQLRWVAAGGCCVLLAPATALLPLLPDQADAAVGTLAILALPTSVGVAVLRYRLYDLGRLLSRTVSYALLTLLLLGLYLSLVALSSALLPRGSSFAVAASTLAAAAVFQPLRRRVQGAVDRRFNLSRIDADRTVDGLARRLRDEVDLDHVRADLLRVTHETLQPASVGLWLRSPQ